jgi:hypothetical protein
VGLVFPNTNFGVLIELKGAKMDVEVEDHGRGKAETRTCDKIRVPTLSDEEAEKKFGGAVALLGRDQFNELKADPVKSEDEKTGYWRSENPTRRTKILACR